MDRVEFKSGELRLEGSIDWPSGRAPYPSGLIAHPHPLFGGTMDNNVVYALRDALVDSGYLALRFNFRGVGKSQGQYGEIFGEAQDVISAERFLKSLEYVNPEKIVACGYSFGALAILYAMANGLKPSALILVSPMLPERGLEKDEIIQKILPLKIPTLILAGGKDQFFRPQLYKPLIPENKNLSKLLLQKSADHLWLGLEREIINSVQEFLKTI